ncbi:hypothetical protein INR49_007866 [Caranx melampygus]|nr:hypothetical protein INR49_007866 [Caranx melampygus]
MNWRGPPAVHVYSIPLQKTAGNRMLYHIRPLEHIISAGLCDLSTAEGQCQPAQEIPSRVSTVINLTVADCQFMGCLPAASSQCTKYHTEFFHEMMVFSIYSSKHGKTYCFTVELLLTLVVTFDPTPEAFEMYHCCYHMCLKELVFGIEDISLTAERDCPPVAEGTSFNTLHLHHPTHSSLMENSCAPSSDLQPRSRLNEKDRPDTHTKDHCTQWKN